MTPPSRRPHLPTAVLLLIFGGSLVACQDAPPTSPPESSTEAQIDAAVETDAETAKLSGEGKVDRGLPHSPNVPEVDLPLPSLEHVDGTEKVMDCIYCPGDEYDATYDPDGDGDMYTYDELEEITDLGLWVTVESDSRVESLTSIAQDEAEKAKNKGVLDEVIAAYHAGDADSIKSLMGYTDSEWQNLNSTAESLASSL